MKKPESRPILKFDSGRKGFDRAILFLVILAFLFILFGVWFLIFLFS